METIKNITLKGEHKPIYADLFFKNDKRPKPVVLFVHGYKGFKDWGCWDLVAQRFAKENLFFIKMNFSHNGTSLETPTVFSDLEAFGNNNFSKEMDDLKTVINWIFQATTFQDNIQKELFTLIGHSRGGGIATLMAKEDERVHKLITWAGVSDFEARFPSGNILETWKEKGVAFIENVRTKQQMPHYIQFYDDFVKNKERFSIKNASLLLKKPTLIVHGTNDNVVPLAEAESLHQWNSASQLQLINGADHSFGGGHPWQQNTLPSHLAEVVDNSIVFVKNLESIY